MSGDIINLRGIIMKQIKKGRTSMQKRFKEKMEELSSLGCGNELCLPHIELFSNREASVEGCVGIIKYDKSFIKLNCHGITVKFSGDCLCINNMNDGLACVTGTIVSVEFGM